MPKAGAVLCFRPTGTMRLGHVAVVSQVLTDRVIQITHANWSLIDGDRGHVERNVTVVDVSPNGDWSQVKVWNDPSHNLGTTVYPTYGFIYQDAGRRRPDRRPGSRHRHGAVRRQPGGRRGSSGFGADADAEPGGRTRPIASPP